MNSFFCEQLATDLDLMLKGEVSEELIWIKYKDDPHVDSALISNLSHFFSDSDIRDGFPEYKSMQEIEMMKFIRLLRENQIEKVKKISFLEMTEDLN